MTLQVSENIGLLVLMNDFDEVLRLSFDVLNHCNRLLVLLYGLCQVSLEILLFLRERYVFPLLVENDLFQPVYFLLNDLVVLLNVLHTEAQLETLGFDFGQSLVFSFEVPQQDFLVLQIALVLFSYIQDFRFDLVDRLQHLLELLVFALKSLLGLFEDHVLLVDFLLVGADVVLEVDDVVVEEAPTLTHLFLNKEHLLELVLNFLQKRLLFGVVELMQRDLSFELLQIGEGLLVLVLDFAYEILQRLLVQKELLVDFGLLLDFNLLVDLFLGETRELALVLVMLNLQLLDAEDLLLELLLQLDFLVLLFSAENFVFLSNQVQLVAEIAVNLLVFLEVEDLLLQFLNFLQLLRIHFVF